MNANGSTSDTVSIPEEIDSWYASKFLRSSLASRAMLWMHTNPLKSPKIFAVLTPRPEYRFTSFDAWRRVMWRPGGLPRKTREAIAVAVAVANQCVY